MPQVAVLLKLSQDRVVRGLQEVGETLDRAAGEVVLDLSSIHRIGPEALCAMEELAVTAAGKGVKLVLHGVNIEVYKVLKLAKLASRFLF